MKICIFGAGAIGSCLAGKLALAGNTVVAIARGAHLEAIEKNGLTLISDGVERQVHFPASADPAVFGQLERVSGTR